MKKPPLTSHPFVATPDGNKCGSCGESRNSRIHRVRSHDFTLSAKEWELAVFDEADHFLVSLTLGAGKRESREYPASELIKAMTEAESRKGPYGRTPTLHAVTASGRSICMDRKDWHGWRLRRFGALYHRNLVEVLVLAREFIRGHSIEHAIVDEDCPNVGLGQYIDGVLYEAGWRASVPPE